MFSLLKLFVAKGTGCLNRHIDEATLLSTHISTEIWFPSRNSANAVPNAWGRSRKLRLFCAWGHSCQQKKLPFCYEAVHRAAFKGGAEWQFYQFFFTGFQWPVQSESESAIPKPCLVWLPQSVIMFLLLSLQRDLETLSQKTFRTNNQK